MVNEGAGTSLDVDRAVSEAVARTMSAITDSISSVIDTRLQAFKQDNSQTVEAAVRRAKHDRYEFKSRAAIRTRRGCFREDGGANQPTSQLQFNRGEPHWRPH